MAKKPPQLPVDPDSGWSDEQDEQAGITKALEQCDEITDSIDDAPESVADRAFDFFSSVRDGVVSMKKTITETNRVTEKQQTALDNWQSGVNRWTDR